MWLGRNILILVRTERVVWPRCSFPQLVVPTGEHGAYDRVPSTILRVVGIPSRRSVVVVVVVVVLGDFCGCRSGSVEPSVA